MRVEAVDDPAFEVSRATFDDADVEVAVLDRAGEPAVLEGGAHDVVLAGRDATAEDEGFGPAADPGADRPDEDVVRAGLGQPLLPQLPDTGGLNPEGLFHVFLLSGRPEAGVATL
jgi:hypothetical protein